MQNYKKLALSYKGKVRFGWANPLDQELLASSLDARFFPQTFLIKDGMAYWYRDFPYENILKSYIDEGKFVNSTTSFEQPRRFIPLQLYVYTYPRKEIRKFYRARVEYDLRVFLAKQFPD